MHVYEDSFLFLLSKLKIGQLMYQDTLDHFANLGRKKANLLKRSPIAFIIGALMAGAYIGFGIILIFSVAATIDPSLQKLVMGVCFGVALTLVVFAGAELFTGHTLLKTLSAAVFSWP
jgi:nitrite transporter NirC